MERILLKVLHKHRSPLRLDACCWCSRSSLLRLEMASNFSESQTLRSKDGSVNGTCAGSNGQ
jgi:hypothetical protein